MSVTFYHLIPLEPANIKAIEQRVLELQKQRREKDDLDTIELDWLDQANTWLDQN